MQGQSVSIQQKIEDHRRFWRGEGPCLILVPSSGQPLYDLNNYSQRFNDPEAMYESERARALDVCDWPTDGIPTVRPNLGVIFIPSIAGQSYQINDTTMPWPGPPLERQAIRQAHHVDPADADLMRRAACFYQIHRDRDADEIAAYHPDTQGVFDLAHLLYGDQIFLDLAEPRQRPWIDELMAICLDLYIGASRQIKHLIGEPAGTMIHGHGTSQGVFFPHAGVRQAEDTATLVSPRMIAQFNLPAVTAAAEPFGNGAFIHWCGRHEALAEQLTGLPCVRAIDLGNPEMYELDELFSLCSRTDTVVYSRLAAKPGEDWRGYLERIGAAVRRHRVRVILRPLIIPKDRSEAADMVRCWHDLTA